MFLGYGLAEKRIWLIRHAKAAAHQNRDHVRELSSRGYRQCIEMGQYLLTHTRPPQLFLTSDARRALTTAHILSAFVRGKVIDVADMYTFDSDQLASVAMASISRVVPDDVDSLALVGHNGAISHIASTLTRGSASISLPTLGIAELAFEGVWGDLFGSANVSLHQSMRPSK